MTKDCPEFQILIECSQRRDLPSCDRERLEEHLVGCDRCSGYAQLVRLTTQRLQLIRATPSVDVDSMLSRVEARVRELKRAATLAMVAAGTALAASVWFIFSDQVSPWWVPLSMGVAMVALMYTGWRLGKRALGVETTRGSGDFLAHWRRDLDKRIKSTCYEGPAVAALFLGLLAFFLVRLGPDNVGAALIFAFAVATVGHAAHGLLIELPRLRRERQTLD